MKISQIEPIRFTPFLNNDPRAAAGTTYISASLMRDDSTRLGPVAEYTIVLPEQTHGSKVGWVTEDKIKSLQLDNLSLSDTRRIFPDTDAILTSIRGLAIGVRTADCLPILFYARDIQVVGAVHAGWRGTLAGISLKTVEELVNVGAKPENIFVRFAPAICELCYEVDNDLAVRFADAGLAGAVHRAPKTDPLTFDIMAQDKPHIDLVKANKIILEKAGVPVSNFYESDLCTRHTALTIFGVKGDETHFPYYSWRRVPGTTRRNTSFVILLPK